MRNKEKYVRCEGWGKMQRKDKLNGKVKTETELMKDIFLQIIARKMFYFVIKT